MVFFAENEMTKKKFKENSFCNFEISKYEVDNLNFDSIDSFIKKLKSFGSVTRQKVLFTFTGYKDDKRELIFIPEVNQYTKELINRYPYFWYYATPDNSEFFFLSLLLREHKGVINTAPPVERFYFEQDKKEIKFFISAISKNLEKFGTEARDIRGAKESLKIWRTKILMSLNISPPL